MAVRTPTRNQGQRYAKSAAAHDRARAVMPGGVNSPARAFKSIDHHPISIRSGSGATITDIDGNQYIDYVCSFGPLILGHAPESVTAALLKATRRGSSFGLPTPTETTLAEMVVEAVPGIEKLRLVNSGTEATMSALRLARAATERPRIIKCAGCYHGHSDSLLVQAGSGAVTHGNPSSPGVPEAITSQTITVPYNDADAVAQVLGEQGDEVAAIILEPVAGNMGCVPPNEGYLQSLRELCDKHGTLLIFDEVMTGFRVSFGGAQQRFGVTPDITCLGKILGGGLPCAAYGASRELMQWISPDGPVYQAGTLSGNPLAMAAGIATLEELRDESNHCYDQIERAAAMLEDGLKRAAESANVPVRISRVGSMLTCFFSDAPVTNFDEAQACRTDRFGAFCRSMLDRGVMLPPSQFEAWFVSTAHDEGTIKQTIEAAGHAFTAAAEIA